MSLSRSVLSPPPLPEQRPEFTVEEARDRAGQLPDIESELRQLDDDQQEIRDELETIRKKLLARRETNERRRRQLVVQREIAMRARRFIVGQSKPWDREIELTERGKSLLAKVGELRAAYNCNATAMDPPEAHQEARRLEDVEREITACQRSIRHMPNAQAGTTNAERRLPKLLGEREGLQKRLEIIRQQWQHFQEIAELKRQADEAFAERDKLRAERESKVLEDALGSREKRKKKAAKA